MSAVSEVTRARFSDMIFQLSGMDHHGLTAGQQQSSKTHRRNEHLLRFN